MMTAISTMRAAPEDTVLGEEWKQLHQDKGEPHFVSSDTLPFKEHWTQVKDTETRQWWHPGKKPEQFGFYNRIGDQEILQGAGSGIDPTVRNQRTKLDPKPAPQRGSKRGRSTGKAADPTSAVEEPLEPSGSIGPATTSKNPPQCPPENLLAKKAKAQAPMRTISKSPTVGLHRAFEEPNAKQSAYVAPFFVNFERNDAYSTSNPQETHSYWRS
jgi:hypothetical protein